MEPVRADALAEQKRVARHIELALGSARSRDLSGLSRGKRLARRLLLGALRSYCEAGNFPKNPGMRVTPIFIDTEGTRCAMAHLMELGGASALVEHVATHHNFARVRELAAFPELAQWLDAAGLTADEAAAIQPSYCDIAAACLCGGTFNGVTNVPATGVLEATVVQAYIAQIQAVYGNVGSFTVGQSVCVNQSTVGADVLIPVQSASDAAQPMPPTDGGVCVPNFAQTFMLDDGGRPLACNYGSQADISLSKQQAIDALVATDCKASLASVDSKWSKNDCDTTSGGCNTTPAIETPATVAVILAVVGALVARARTR